MTRTKEYPESSRNAITWEHNGCVPTITKALGSMSHWCGHARIPNWPKGVSDSYHDEPIGSLDVHGGITYSEPSNDGSLVIGFDCAHLGDDTDPRTTDETWLRSETERMTDQIVAAIAELAVAQ